MIWHLIRLFLELTIKLSFKGFLKHKGSLFVNKEYNSRITFQASYEDYIF